MEKKDFLEILIAYFENDENKKHFYYDFDFIIEKYGETRGMFIYYCLVESSTNVYLDEETIEYEFDKNDIFFNHSIYGWNEYEYFSKVEFFELFKYILKNYEDDEIDEKRLDIFFSDDFYDYYEIHFENDELNNYLKNKFFSNIEHDLDNAHYSIFDWKNDLNDIIETGEKIISMVNNNLIRVKNLYRFLFEICLKYNFDSLNLILECE